MARRREAMAEIARQIDRDGEYRQPVQLPTVECDHCHALRVRVKDGLCVTCRRVLGLMHAPSSAKASVESPSHSSGGVNQ